MADFKNLANLESLENSGIEDIIGIENIVAIEDIEGGEDDMNSKQRGDITKALENTVNLVKIMVENSDVFFMTRYYKKLFLCADGEEHLEWDIDLKNDKKQKGEEAEIGSQEGKKEVKNGKKGNKVDKCGWKEGDVLPSVDTVELIEGYLKKLVRGNSSYTYGSYDSDYEDVSEERFKKAVGKFENLFNSYIAYYRCVSFAVFSLLSLFSSLTDEKVLESREMCQFINSLIDSVIFEISFKEFN